MKRELRSNIKISNYYRYCILRIQERRFHPHHLKLRYTYTSHSHLIYHIALKQKSALIYLPKKIFFFLCWIVLGKKSWNEESSERNSITPPSFVFFLFCTPFATSSVRNERTKRREKKRGAKSTLENSKYSCFYNRVRVSIFMSSE